MNSEYKERVLAVLRRVTGKNVTELNLETDLRSQLSLDSIQVVELFAALEKEFEVELPLSLMTVKTGKAFLQMLEEELNQ